MNAVDTRPGVEAILEAGRSSVTAKDRFGTLEVTYRDTTVAIPIVASSAGGVAVLRDAYDLAKQAHDLQSPERSGRYSMADLESLLAWAARYKTADTAAFLRAPTVQQPGAINVVIDELPTNNNGAHRRLSAQLALRFSDLLLEWLKLNSQWQTAEQFYSFIDEHTDELQSADVLTMAKNIEVKSESTFKRTVSDDGKVKLVLEDQSGPSMTVPRKFGFLAPIFSFDGEFRVPTFTARLALKLDKGRPMFRYEIVDLPGRVQDAMHGLRDAIVKTVPLVYMGAQG